ncbi:MAG: hypothetical protein Q7K40_02160 [bacterium]|nr:hypothetical protein [bacterium]
MSNAQQTEMFPKDEASVIDIIVEAVGGAGDLVKLGVGYPRVVYRKLIIALLAMSGIVFCGFILNVLAYFAWAPLASILYGINITSSIVFAILVAILWWRPRQVAWVAVAGAIIGDPKIKGEHGGFSNGAKWLIEEYLNIFKIVAIIGTVSLFYLGFIPFGANPGAFFVIIGGSIAVGLLSSKYEQLRGTFAVELAFYGICVIIALAFLSLVPTTSWGVDKPFMSQFMLALIGNIKEGLFLFGILFATTVTLMVRRKKANAEDKKGWPWLIITLFGIMDGIFMPWSIAVDAMPWRDRPAVSQVAREQMEPKNYPTKTIPLTSSQSVAIYPLPSGGQVWYCCTTPGAEMMVDYDSAESAFVSPKEWFACPLRGEEVNIGKMLVNTKYYFRSKNGGEAIITNVLL